MINLYDWSNTTYVIIFLIIIICWFSLGLIIRILNRFTFGCIGRIIGFIILLALFLIMVL